MHSRLSHQSAPVELDPAHTERKVWRGDAQQTEGEMRGQATCVAGEKRFRTSCGDSLTPVGIEPTTFGWYLAWTALAIWNPTRHHYATEPIRTLDPGGLDDDMVLHPAIRGE